MSLAARHYMPHMSKVVRWLMTSRETTNFTYDLTPKCMKYLAHTLSIVTGCSPNTVEAYLSEPIQNQALIDHVALRVRQSPFRFVSDRRPKFGKRLGWYAIARAIKPRVVVETGIDKGLGSLLLCAALLRNKQEGYPGTYYGTDINRDAGFLLSGEYATMGRILYGDSIANLETLSAIDLFINDSDHSADYEAREYETIEAKLTPSAIVVGDNAHATDALVRFAEHSGRRFLFFREDPADHWYPGGGLGICYPENTSDVRGTI